MPIYEYQCKTCGHHLEAIQKMSDGPLRKCPACGRSRLVRLMSAPVFRLKGGGWYETDFKSDTEAKRNLHGEDKAEKADKADKADKAATADKAAPAVTDTAASKPEPVAAPATTNDGAKVEAKGEAKGDSQPAARRQRSASTSRAVKPARKPAARPARHR